MDADLTLGLSPQESNGDLTVSVLDENGTHSIYTVRMTTDRNGGLGVELFLEERPGGGKRGFLWRHTARETFQKEGS